MKKTICVILCILQIALLFGYSASAASLDTIMFDWESFTGKAQAIEQGVIEEGTSETSYSGHYAGIVTITNATNHPAAQNGLLDGTVKALMIQNRRMVTINNTSSGDWAFKINLDTTAMSAAEELKMYMCYEYSADHVVGVKLTNGICYYYAGFNDSAANSAVYYQQWNWYSFLGKTFKQCGYGTDSSKNITIDSSNIKTISSILIWNRYDTGSTTDTNYSRIYIDNVQYVTEGVENPVTVTVDGVENTVEKGSEYTFAASDADGFIAYTDGENFYDEGDTVTVADNLEFTTVSIGSVAMNKGAAIRLNYVTGIRFYTTVDADAIESVKTAYNATVSKGTLITPYDYLNDEELTLNSSFDAVNVEYTADTYYQPNTFVGSIIGIKESSSFDANSGNLAREFIGRGYITVKIGDYTKTVYADYTNNNAANNARSLAYVAYQYKNDSDSSYSTLSEEIKAVVNKWAALNNTDAFFNMISKNYVNKIKTGINTGRSLDCRITKSGDEYTVADLNATEQKYDFIQPTDTELIKAFKSAGYNAVRMPVTWSEAIGDAPDYQVSDILMDRVVEVVDMILEQDMYCILNTHNEFNWLYTQNSDLDAMYAKYTALWHQIAERFKDYDGRLIFEGYNEVLKKPDDWGEKQDSDYEVVNTLAQKFVDTVRATGLNNEKRFLIVSPYGAWLGETEISKLTVPTDSAKDKILVNVHFYFPQGALPDGGLVDTDTAKADIDKKFEIIKSYLTDKGYTVIIDEFGIADHNALDVRVMCTEYIAEKATDMDIPMFWWDNSCTFGVFDRSAAPYEQVYPEIIEAMMNGIGTAK
ncbi:MAG: glycoside hydrolase family 5 protein [Acutalibacteraceae bacterium]